MEEKEDRSFSVRDRRTDTSSGKQPQQKHDAGAQQPPETESGQQQQHAAPAQDLDFSTFVISLASSAQVNLGAMPHPETNQTSQNFPAAKQMIDILTMVQAKTKGNLTEAETALVEQVLFSLRMHYVRAVEGQNKSGG